MQKKISYPLIWLQGPPTGIGLNLEGANFKNAQNIDPLVYRLLKEYGCVEEEEKDEKEEEKEKEEKEKEEED